MNDVGKAGIRPLGCWMKDERCWQNQPLAARAASLWSAVASQTHQSNPAPEAPGKGGITTTRTIITNPHRFTPSKHPSAAGAPGATRRRPQSGLQTINGGDSRQQPLATNASAPLPLTFIFHPSSNIVMAQRAIAFNLHPSSFIYHPVSMRVKPVCKQAGFTLIELIISMIIFGVMTMIYMQYTGGALSAHAIAHDEEQSALNNRLGSILLDYAAIASTTGQLPAPYTSGTTRYAIYDPANTTMQSMLAEARIRPAEANDDGTAMANVRVYQRVTGLTTTIPLYGVSGPATTLTYQEAVIIATHCERTATCNTVGTGGIPGSSGTFTSANLGTFTLAGDDYGLARISTLSLQKLKLRRTVENIDNIRTRMQEIFRERQRQAAANDTTNFYPSELVAVPAASVGATTDCHASWLRLDNSDILSQIGLINTVNGINAWGGQIHYCRDYDPTGLAAANAPPHFAALRILASPSNGGNPNTANNTGNIVIPF